MIQYQRVYTPSSSLELLTACKKAGISVASAIHSAYLAAVWNLAPVDRRDYPYACVMPAQMRRRLPVSSLYRDQGCWNSARLLFLTAPAGQDFRTRALELRRQYLLAEDETWQHEDIYEWNEQTMNYFIKTPNQSNSIPFITQIGLLDGDTIVSEHDDITIENVCVWADSLGLGVILGQWGFRGRLNVQMSWNRAFHREDHIQTVMEAIDKIFKEELGVDM